MKIRRKKSAGSSLPKEGLTLVCDTETTGLNLHREDEVFAIGLLDKENDRILYWETDVFPDTRVPVIPHPGTDDLFDEIKFMLEDGSNSVVFHNAKYDLLGLSKAGIFVDSRQVGRVHDTSYAARICNTLEADVPGGSYKLKYLAQKYCGIPNQDELDLKEAVTKLRAAARRRGWKIAEVKKQGDEAADYWLVRYAAQLGFGGRGWEDLCSTYCQLDCFRTLALWELYSKVMDKDENFLRTYTRELTLLPAVQAMEQRGMHISRRRNRAQIELCKRAAEHHLAEVRKIVKVPDFNPGSSLQVSKVLYGNPATASPEDRKKYPVMFGLEVGRRTEPTARNPEGNASTDWKALRPHQGNPFVRELVLYKSAQKGSNDFFEKFERLMRPDYSLPGNEQWLEKRRYPDSFVIRCSLNQCGTITGRFSSSDPNMQQISNPESSPRGTNIHARQPFGPRPGYYWYSVDYAQQELRVFADCAQVRGMISEILAGRDVNNYVTNQAWGGEGNPHALEAMAHSLELGNDSPTRQEIQDVWNELGWTTAKAKKGARSDMAFAAAETYLARFDYDIVKAEKSVMKSQSRQRGKTVMFAKYYGGGASAVMDLLYCTESEAKQFMGMIDKPFPEINTYIKSLSARARKDGYIINRYGRKLQVHPEFSYRAVNYMIQSSCADMMKSSIIRCHQLFQESGLDAHVLMTIHDELIFEIRKDHAYKWLLRKICEIMEDTEGAINVPIGVEIKRMAKSWENKKPIGWLS